ncbi:MAG: haloacid dehalogenase type II, partial [Acidimicrobiia bacterium]
DALVFDLYGTLLEIASVGRAAAGVTDEPGAFVDLVRQKQIEYTWLRSLMGRYQDFWVVTGDALDYTLERRGVEVDPAGRERLLAAWLDVAPYPEVPDALARLAPRALAVLSNGSPSMLADGLAAGGLTKAITHVISVHALSTYKPHPTVYALAGRELGLPPERMLFVSSNPWDAAGARSFGLPVAWVNRAGAPFERLGVTPDLVVGDLSELVAALAPR